MEPRRLTQYYAGPRSDEALRHLRLAASLAVLLQLPGCCITTEETARAWRDDMKEGLVPGYENFKAIDCDGDIGWSLFSYDLPTSFDVTTTVRVLHAQIDGTAPSFGARPGGFAARWMVVKEDATELQLRYPTVTYGSEGYDEWRLRVDATRRRVTAMYSNLDSPVERDSYPLLLQAFEKAYSAR